LQNGNLIFIKLPPEWSFENSPAIHGWVWRVKGKPVPPGTTENKVSVRQVLSSLTGLEKRVRAVPSTKVLGYFQSAGRMGRQTCHSAVGAA
jgi:hypothetical protein